MADAMPVEQAMRVGQRIDHHHSRFVELEMPLDQRQGAAPDRAETDHYYRPGDHTMDRVSSRGHCHLHPPIYGKESTTAQMDKEANRLWPLLHYFQLVDHALDHAEALLPESGIGSVEPERRKQFPMMACAPSAQEIEIFLLKAGITALID